MVRSAAIEIIARRLNLNAGRLAALAQRAAEAGEIPMACGRSVPDLSPVGLGKLLLCAVADRGLGKAAASVREFAALRNEGGSVLIDLLEAWAGGTVSVSSVHSLIVQLRPPGVTVVTRSNSRHYGAPRDHTAAVRIVTVPGDALRAIVAEL
jgi:hypothetical protein